jgi:hypothetical protein
MSNLITQKFGKPRINLIVFLQECENENRKLVSGVE